MKRKIGDQSSILTRANKKKGQFDFLMLVFKITKEIKEEMEHQGIQVIRNLQDLRIVIDITIRTLVKNNLSLKGFCAAKMKKNLQRSFRNSIPELDDFLRKVKDILLSKR